MHTISHNIVEGITSSCKTRILQRGGQIAVSDVKGLLFIEQKPGQGTATVLNLLKEKYLEKKEVSDFIEYARDHFVVSCLNGADFYLVSREEQKTTPILSLNDGYVSLGMQMMPCYENMFVLVRDTRGIQMLDLVTLKSHQLFLTEIPIEFSDVRFLQVLFSEETQRYTFITLHKDRDHEADGVPITAEP